MIHRITLFSDFQGQQNIMTRIEVNRQVHGKEFPLKLKEEDKTDQTL